MSNSTINIFAHLARGFSAETWNRKYTDGTLIGINEPYAYGFYKAANYGAVVHYSKDGAEGPIGKLLRLGFRVLLQFDPVHAWRNREGILSADAVWTFTESQSLGVLLLLEILRVKKRPKLVAQITYLFDRWDRLSVLHRRLFQHLLSKTDVLAVLSPVDVEIATKILPNVRIELVRFGIATDTKRPPDIRAAPTPIRLLSAGNDAHRDWATLIETVKSSADIELKIVSKTINRRLVDAAPNTAVAPIGSNADYLALFDWADLFVVSTIPNTHTSGLTVIQEAAVRGVPVICNDSEGLRAYFTDTEVKFVPALDPAALLTAIRDLAADPAARRALAERAQAKMGPDGLSSDAYVRQYMRLSKEITGLLIEEPMARSTAA